MAIAINDNTRQSIPFFSENQVLRAEDLNQLVNAVLGQLRQSRVFTIGLGIREGFDVRWDDDSGELIVSDGYGVSSNGYGFELEQCNFTHHRRPRTGFSSFVPLAGGCDEYGRLISLIASQGFELAGDLNLVELQQGWSPLRELTTEQGGTYCLLYLYREVSVAEPSCFNECESKGAEQAGSYHAILVPAAAYADIFGRRENEDDGVLIDLSPYSPRLPALGRQEKLVKLCELSDWNEFYASYRKACAAVMPALAEAYGAVEVALTPDLNGPPSEAPIAKRLKDLEIDFLGKIYSAEPELDCPDVQYLYAWLRELILAFDALKEALNGKLLYVGGEQGNSGGIRCAFPGHLGLRSILIPPGGDGTIQVSEVSEKTDPCRTAYLPPGASPERQQLRALAAALFARLEALVNPGNLLLPTLGRKEFQEIRITPDARRFPFLDGRALPFYYRKAVLDPWRVGEQPNAVAYHYVASDKDHPLLFADTGWDFYRIEGHLGRPISEEVFILETERLEVRTLVSQIEKTRDCYNLAFDVVAVQIDEPSEESSAPSIAGTDWENWYKNVRFDLLLWLRLLSENEATQNSLPSIKGVVAVISQWERLSDVNDWEEFPYDICEPLPDELTSRSLNAFVFAYQSFLRELEVLEQRTETESIWQFDPEMAVCIQEAAIAQRLFEERVWRKQFFAGFAQEHPGLVHEGGVPKGGTFVLVYKSNFNREEIILFLLRRKYPEDYLREQSDADLLRLATSFGWEDTDDQQTRVVADFCLPYLCCGSGPVHLHYPPPAPLPVPLELSVTNEPCFSKGEFPDGYPVTVMVNEVGGDISFATAGSVPVGASYPMATQNETIFLDFISEGVFVDHKLDLIATYEKDGRTITAPLSVSLRPRFDQIRIDLDTTPLSPDGTLVQYKIFFSVNPEGSVLNFFVGGEDATYDSTQDRLSVSRILIEENEELEVLVTVLFRECSSEVSFDLPRFFLDNDPVNPNPDVDTPDPVILSNVLNARRTNRQNELTALSADDAALADSEAFKRAYLYVSDAGPGVNPGNGLKPTLNALSVLVKADPTQSNAVRKIGGVLATSFLDKLAVIGKKEALTKTRKAMLDTLRKGLDELEVNVKTVFSDWGVSDLYAGIDKARLTNIGKQLRK